jgi:hypothetical protein
VTLSGKSIRISLLSAAVVALAAMAATTRALNRALAADIPRIGRQVAGVSVRVGSVRTSILRRHFTITGLEVGNPKGCTGPLAASIERITASFELLSLLRDETVLTSIQLEKPTVMLECTDDATNIELIMEHLLRSQSGAQAAGGNAAPGRLHADLLEITGGTVEVITGPGAGVEQVSLPDVQFHSMTGGSGVSPAELGLVGLQILYSRFLSAAEGSIAEQDLAEMRSRFRRELEDQTRAAEAAARKRGEQYLLEHADEIQRALQRRQR